MDHLHTLVIFCLQDCADGLGSHFACSQLWAMASWRLLGEPTLSSGLFYDYTRVQHGLLVDLCCSSDLQQLPQWITMGKKETWIFEERDVDKEKRHADEENKKFQIASRQRHQDVKTCLCCNKDENDPIKELCKLLRLNPDWKWQPIATQSAILFCLGISHIHRHREYGQHGVGLRGAGSVIVEWSLCSRTHLRHFALQCWTVLKQC